MKRQTSPSHDASAEQQSPGTTQQQQRPNEISQGAFFETSWTMSDDFANPASYQCPMTDFQANDDGSSPDLSPQSYSGFFIQHTKETPWCQTSQSTAHDVLDTSLDLCCTQSALAMSAGLQ